MNRTLVNIFIGGLISVVLLLGLYIGRGEISIFVWNNLGWDGLALSLDSENPALLADIGIAYFSNISDVKKSYDLDKAEFYLTRAIEVSRRGNPNARYYLGRVHFVQGRNYDALARFNEVLELTDDLKEDYVFNTYYMRGLLQGHIGSHSEGIDDFKFIIENKEFSKRPDFIWALYADIGWLLFQEGEYEEVLKYSNEGLEDFPQNPWLLANKGAALLNLDRALQAKEVLEIARSEVKVLTTEQWGMSFPGNDPQSYDSGLSNMVAAIEANYQLALEGSTAE